MFNNYVLDKYVEEEIKRLPSKPEALLVVFRELSEAAQQARIQMHQDNVDGKLLARYYRDWTRNHDIAYGCAQKALEAGVEPAVLQTIADEFDFEPLPI